MAALPIKCEVKTWEELLKIQAKMAKFMFAMRYVGRIKTPQVKIAKVIGTSFQQVQKVEKTENGMSADKFLYLCKQKKWNINDVLEKEPEEFLADIKKEYHKKVLHHFKVVDVNIEKERQLQLRYRGSLPTLEKELAYQNTFKEPVADSYIEEDNKKFA